MNAALILISLVVLSVTAVALFTVYAARTLHRISMRRRPAFTAIAELAICAIIAVALFILSVIEGSGPGPLPREALLTSIAFFAVGLTACAFPADTQMRLDRQLLSDLLQ